MQYKVCPDCGANLDPGERCSCSYAAQRLDIARLIDSMTEAQLDYALALLINEKDEEPAPQPTKARH